MQFFRFFNPIKEITIYVYCYVHYFLDDSDYSNRL